MEKQHSFQEIDIFSAFHFLIKQKWMVIGVTIIGMIIGIIQAYSHLTLYTASTSFIIGGMASQNSKNPLANITNSTSKEGEIPLPLFPKFLASIPIQQKIAEIPIKIERIGKTITYREYILNHMPTPPMASIKKYTIGLPSLLFSKNTPLKKVKKIQKEEHFENEIWRISPEDNIVFSQIQNNLLFELNENNMMTLSFSMEEPLASAQMTQQITTIFQNFLQENQLKKTKEKIAYTELLYKNAEKDFKEKQMRVASFQDANRGMITFLPQTRLGILQAEYNIAYQVFMELSKDFEKQKMLIKEKNIIFSVINPVSIPLSPTQNNKIITILKWSLGSFFAILILLVGIFTLGEIKKMYHQRTQHIS